MAKKSVEELDAELAALEAELAALESGAGAPPKPKKPKRGRRAEAEAPAPTEAPEAPEGPAPAEAEAPAEAAKPRRFALGRKARPEGPEPAAPEGAEPAPAKPRFGLRRGRRAEPEGAPAPPAEDMAPPAPAAPLVPAPPPPPPEPAGPSTAWESRGRAWRASPAGPSKVEVVRRQVDAEGRVVAEQQIGEELVAPAAPEAPAPAAGLFGRLRRREEAPAEPAAGSEPPAPGVEAVGAPAPRRRKPLILAAVLVAAALLAVAVVLPALGVDPLGTGALLGVGGAGEPPLGTFALSANVVAIGAPLTFDASESRDPAGGALEYSWDFGDGGGDRGARVTHRYEARGTYTVTLTVRNAAGQEARFAQQVQVLAPPVALARVQLEGAPPGDANPAFAGVELTFDGSGSTASNASISAYQWSFGDGSAPATGASAKHTYAAAGAYRAALTVTDSNGLRGNDSLVVYVGAQTLTTGEAPASLDGRKAVNHTVAVVQRGGALGFAPVALRATLTFNGTTGGTPVGGVLPGGVNPDDLLLTVYDASGAVVAAASGAASPKTVEVTSFTAPGAWNLEVARPQGGAQPMPYTLLVELVNGRL